MSIRQTKQKITLSDLKDGIKHKEFELHYQPKVSMITGEISGAEALIRWRKRDGTLVPPMDFIPLAEESNFIREITKYVFDKLVVDCAVISAVNSAVAISFNTSGKDFHDDELTKIITAAVNSRLIDPTKLEIEVTETILVGEGHTKDCLNQLSALGIPIAMDDFGTGHSGLVELSKWPFSIIKIDQKFVRGLNESPKDREILQASIRMAHQLNMNVVAEGIEDEETYRVLQEYGCKIGQGYWISKPLSFMEFILFLKQFENLPAMPVGLLYMAQLDHIQWRKTLIDTALFLHGSNEKRELKNLRGSPELQHTRCKLGLWYYGAGRKLSDIKSYKQLEQPHMRLHAIGKELLSAASNHCSMDELTTLIQRLSEKSLEVLEMLQTLENSLHVDQYSEHSIPVE